MLSLPDHQNGDDITLMDTYYEYPHKIENGEEKSKYTKDYICIMYKDNRTGKKHHHIIENPEYEFYMADPQIQLDHNLLFINKNKVIPYSTPYTQLNKKIAELTGNETLYYNNIQSGNRSANKILHKVFNIFNSDMNINDHYRFQFDKTYENRLIPVSKAFFDIEVDTIHMAGDFPELGECPINAVSYIYKNKITVFLLRNPNNPLIAKFEEEVKTDTAKLFNELNNFIIDNVGGLQKASKFKVDHLGYEMLFYDEEICLINDLFSLINKNEPDFLLAWNMAFDIPYCIERTSKLGYSPEDIMCHPDFDKNHRVVKYFIDEQHSTEYAERGDKYTISGHTVYLDQLIHFASRRKGQAAFPNFKLDTAGNIITGVRKLDYSHITTNISMLPYLDYKTFVFYNIMDTIVQKCIEEEVKDIDYIFGKCLMNNTRYDKGHRQTVYLVNRATKEFYKNGYIIGNNVSDGNSVKFMGALVHDPVNNSSFMKKKIGNQVINVADNLNDFDFKSLYPSTARENNMAPNTQIGKIIIPEQVHRYENPFGEQYYDRGGQYIEDLTCQNIITFCQRWMNFPTFKEWIEDIYKYYTQVEYPIFRIDDNENRNILLHECPIIKGKKIPLMEEAEELKGKKIQLLTPIAKPLNYRPYIDYIKKGIY